MVTPTTGAKAEMARGGAGPGHGSTAVHHLQACPYQGLRRENGQVTLTPVQKQFPSGPRCVLACLGSPGGEPHPHGKGLIHPRALRWVLPRILPVPPRARLWRAPWRGSVLSEILGHERQQLQTRRQPGLPDRAKRVALRAAARKSGGRGCARLPGLLPRCPICNPLTSHKGLQLFSFIMLRTTN